MISLGNWAQVFKKSNKANKNKTEINVCFEFSTDFQTENTINYIDDLNTLKLIVDAFSSEKNAMNWGVIGSDISTGGDEHEARLYSEFSKYVVDTVGWSQ